MTGYLEEGVNAHEVIANRLLLEPKILGNLSNRSAAHQLPDDPVLLRRYRYRPSRNTFDARGAIVNEQFRIAISIAALRAAADVVRAMGERTNIVPGFVGPATIFNPPPVIGNIGQ